MKTMHAKPLHPRLVLDFTRNLLVLLESGFTLKDALSHCNKGNHGSPLELFHQAVNKALDNGQPFSQALEPWRSSFGSLFLSLVHIGEHTGDLKSVLGQLLDYLDQKHCIKDRLISSLVYPALVLTLTLFGLLGLFTVGLPVLLELVSTLNHAARVNFDRSLDTLRSTFLILGLAVLPPVATLLWLAPRLGNFPVMRLKLHRFLWRTPLIGTVWQAMDALYLSFAMENLLESGFQMDQALEEAAKTVGNAYFKDGIRVLLAGLRAGKSARVSGSHGDSFPLVMKNWLALSEYSASQGLVFGQLRRFYQHELSVILGRLMTLIEPLMILLLGILMVFLVQTILVPFFAMMGNVL